MSNCGPEFELKEIKSDANNSDAMTIPNPNPRPRPYLPSQAGPTRSQSAPNISYMPTPPSDPIAIPGERLSRSTLGLGFTGGQSLPNNQFFALELDEGSSEEERGDFIPPHEVAEQALVGPGGWHVGSPLGKNGFAGFNRKGPKY